MKTINGKAIRSPQGRAGEYAVYACDFFCGCSCGCTYCFNKTGRFKNTLGGDKPTLKKCFKNEEHALEVFEKELKANLPELQKHGLFFSFLTDPLLPEIIWMTKEAIRIATDNIVPVWILTKNVSFDRLYEDNDDSWMLVWDDIYCAKSRIAFGFTLTGHDELEPNASTNAERIEAMRQLHGAGFKTWASIEPVIDIESSLEMIRLTRDFCCSYKIGIEKGKKYDEVDLLAFINDVCVLLCSKNGNKPVLYFKDSLLKAAGVRRENLPVNCVTRDYNIFND
jgi:DNA repair photolyase